MVYDKLYDLYLSGTLDYKELIETAKFIKEAIYDCDKDIKNTISQMQVAINKAKASKNKEMCDRLERIMKSIVKTKETIRKIHAENSKGKK